LDYLTKCWIDFQNDECGLDQALYLFSYLISRGKAFNISQDVSEMARNLINNDWIDEEGRVLVDPAKVGINDDGKVYQKTRSK